MTIESLIQYSGTLHVADIGAAAINEVPPYKALLERGLARLTAVDGDARQIARISELYPGATVLDLVLADGRRHKLHLCSEASGMSSILKPNERALAFFNGFRQFGSVERVIEVETQRLGDVEQLRSIDLLKMDIQGAELLVLEHAGTALDGCVAVQLEASFVALYEGQPGFGEIDLWMRRNGFQPHRLMDLKRWSIAPLVRDNDFRLPFNQLLECDVVYMRGLTDLGGLTDAQVSKMLLIAIYCYASPDLMTHCGLELERRGAIPAGTAQKLLVHLPR